MKGKYFSGLPCKTLLTKFPLRLRKQFLNLADLIKFSYVMTEIKNPMIISQLLLKRQQYKYVLEKKTRIQNRAIIVLFLENINQAFT